VARRRTSPVRQPHVMYATAQNGGSTRSMLAQLVRWSLSADSSLDLIVEGVHGCQRCLARGMNCPGAAGPEGREQTLRR
jgi:hypothetical protein